MTKDTSQLVGGILLLIVAGFALSVLAWAAMQTFLGGQ